MKKKNRKNEAQADVANANVGLACLKRRYLVLKIQKMHQSLTVAFILNIGNSSNIKSYATLENPLKNLQNY